jgi:sugar/nucleoside kinase (ribokinase family)
LPANPSGIRKLLLEEEAQGASSEILARMAAAIRSADIVIAGSLTDEDRAIRGLLPHLADLSSNAYRVLRPPAPLIGHAGFAQLAKKFQYVQMSHEEARRLAAGTSDLGILTQVLRKRLGEGGEFAITRFGGRGVLWADNKEWEIEPIAEDDADKPSVADAFCTAWVAARRFSNVGVPQALAAARKAAAKALAAGRPRHADRSP